MRAGMKTCKGKVSEGESEREETRVGFMWQSIGY